MSLHRKRPPPLWHGLKSQGRPAVGESGTVRRPCHNGVNSDRPMAKGVAAMRIALIKPSALGDVVHALPVLGALRHRFPHAHLTWVVNRAYEPLLKGHPALDATLPFDRGALRGGWRAALAHALRFG